MDSLFTFIAHFHPVLVHLPIGMLLAALLLQALARRPAYAGLRPAVPVMLLAGVISAIASCVTGWLLSQSGEYDAGLVAWHRWMGIGLTLLSGVVYWRVRRRGFDRAHTVLSLGLFGFLLVTGHLGGSLTHGADWLSFGGGRPGEGVVVDSPIVHVQEARAYADIVRPILRDHCYSCHGATRQKGGLRMDEPAGLMKGGKDGVVILAGRADASELIKRLALPVEEEHHMPPKEKKQLNERQLALLHWWIDQGADVTHTVAELKQPDAIRPVLLGLQESRSRVVGVSDVPAEAVEAADARALAALRAKGVRVMPVAQNSNWLEADFGGGTGGGSAVAAGVAAGERGAGLDLALLLPLKKQLISLRLDNTGVGDSALGIIRQCVALRSLNLAHTRITDGGLAGLTSLVKLRVLNLVGTEVSAKAVAGLRGVMPLRSVYLYRTKVGSGDWAMLKKAFPAAMLDTGGYSIPVLVTDTAVVRQPQGVKK
jgi:uncharacterized membrane protein/mono/diheme cytochrome c family protein